MSFEVYQFHLMFSKALIESKAIDSMLTEAAESAAQLFAVCRTAKQGKDFSALDWGRDMDSVDDSRISCGWVKNTRSFFLQLAVEPNERSRLERDIDDLILSMKSLKEYAITREMTADRDQIREWLGPGGWIPLRTPAMRKHLCRHDEGKGCDPWEDLWGLEEKPLHDI